VKLAEVGAFLTHLAAEHHVAAATQNQAKSALLFLYGQVLRQELPWLDEVVTARTRQRLPVVLTVGEVRALLHELGGTMGLVAALLYGTGMRLLEGLRLRVKDVEFERRELLVRNGKGGKDRVTVLPENLLLPLRAQLAHARSLHDGDLRAGFGAVWIPDALRELALAGRRRRPLVQPCLCQRLPFVREVEPQVDRLRSRRRHDVEHRPPAADRVQRPRRRDLDLRAA
jgi:integrase